jgi:hypothetical protein
MIKSLSSPKLFKSVRGSYLPIKLGGWLTYIPYIGYLVFSLKIISDQFVSMSLKIISVFAQWIVATLVMTVIAKNLS